MTEAEFAMLMLMHFERLFPKTCGNCGRVYPTLRDYMLSCKPLGPVIVYDAELEDWNPEDPIGAVAQANCPCGNTLALGTNGMSLSAMRAALDWVRGETKSRGVSYQELLGRIRSLIREQVLSESAEASSTYQRQP